MPGIRIDNSILEAALVGCQHELTQIEARMADLRRQINSAGGRVTAGSNGPQGLRKQIAPRKKRRLSAAGRRNIIQATKKRWAAYRAAKAHAATA